MNNCNMNSASLSNTPTSSLLDDCNTLMTTRSLSGTSALDDCSALDGTTASAAAAAAAVAQEVPCVAAVTALQPDSRNDLLNQDTTTSDDSDIVTSQLASCSTSQQESGSPESVAPHQILPCLGFHSDTDVFDDAMPYMSSQLDELTNVSYNQEECSNSPSDGSLTQLLPLSSPTAPPPETSLDHAFDAIKSLDDSRNCTSSFEDQCKIRQISEELKKSSEVFSMCSQHNVSNDETKHVPPIHPAVQLNHFQENPASLPFQWLLTNSDQYSCCFSQPIVPSDDSCRFLQCPPDHAYNSLPSYHDAQAQTKAIPQSLQLTEISEKYLATLRSNRYAPKVLIALAKDRETLQEVLFTTLSNAVNKNNQKVVTAFVKQDNLKLFVSRSKTELQRLLYDAVKTTNPTIVKALLNSKLKNLYNLQIRLRVLHKAIEIRQLEREDNPSMFSETYEESKKEADCFAIVRSLLTCRYVISYIPRIQYREHICSMVVSMLDVHILKYMMKLGLKLSHHNTNHSWWGGTRDTLVDVLTRSIYFWEKMKVGVDCYAKGAAIELLELLSRHTKVHHDTLKHLVGKGALSCGCYNIAAIPIYHGACVRVRSCCNFGGTGILRRMFEQDWPYIDTQFCLLLLNLGDKPPGEILLEEYQQYEQYKEACEALQAVAGTPISLQDHCRICIREHVKDNCEDFADAILALPLPGFILQYLLGRDYSASE